MDNIKWEANWTDTNGRNRSYIFTGPSARSLARLDFRLKLLDAGEKIPEHFEIEADEPTMLLPRIDLRGRVL